MSEYLGQMLSKEICLDKEIVELLTKGLCSLTTQQRRLLNGELKETVSQIEVTVKNAWAKANEEEKAKWLEITVESILDKCGDRDFLDKLAIRLISPLKVYHRVQRLSEERGIVLKTSRGVFLIAITVVLGLALILLNYR